jgi:hypothetical protein
MITVTGAYIIEYRPGGLYLGEKDGALNLQTIPEHPTIIRLYFPGPAQSKARIIDPGILMAP